jgi:transcriptional regulator with XRE-family HTH domain
MWGGSLRSPAFATHGGGPQTGCMSPVSASGVGAFLREQREQARLTVTQLAQAAGLPSSSLAQLERGVRKPSAEVLQQIARGLQASAGVLYDQGAIVAATPDGPGDSGAPGVRESVLADPGLTARQKQMLLEVYESLRKETAQAAAAGGEQPAGDRPGTDEPPHNVPSNAGSG